MQIPFSEIMACTTTALLSQKVEEILSRYAPDNPPSISDCLVNVQQGGHHMTLELGYRADTIEPRLPESQRFTWKIEVLRDEWGNKPQPGDKVQRTIKLPLRDKSDNIIGGHDLSRMIADGTYKDKFEITYEYEVDEKGCISCNYHDAAHFLNLWGIHYRTRAPMTNKPEHTTDPVRCPDGSMKNVWYWRFREVPKEEYDNMPVIEKKSSAKRGYSK